MPKEIRVVAQKRVALGSGRVQRLRRTGWIPAVVCSEKGQAESIQLNAREFERLLDAHVSGNLIITLDVEGSAGRKTLLREVQQDPILGHVLHADFVEISMTRKMRVGIPLQLVGEPTGVSQQSGVLEHVLRTLEVECLPVDLVESIAVDVSHMNIGDTLLVRDLKVDPKLTVLTTGDVAIATVAAPRREEEVVAEVAAAVPGEPEVITAKKEGEEGEGEEAAKGKEKGKESKDKESKDKGKEKGKEKAKE